MDSRKIIFLLLLCSTFIYPVDARITAGGCSDTVIGSGATCTETGFRDEGSGNNQTVWKVQDIDCSTPPYQAWIKVTPFWDSLGTFLGEDTTMEAGDVWRYTNPDDSGDYVEFELNAFTSCSEPYSIQSGDVHYQQTSHVKTTGNDSNSGNRSSDAWLTINKAFTTLTAGEDAIIYTGTYKETFPTCYSPTGLSNAPIIVKGDGNYPTIQNTTTTYAAGSTLNALLWLHEADYFTITGFNMINQRTGVTYGNAILGCESGSTVDNSTDVEISDIIFNTTSNSLYFYSPATTYTTRSGYNITNNIFENNGAYMIQPPSTNNYIYNNVFEVGGSSFSNGWYPNKTTTGNYWHAYTGIDGNGDSIGDTPMETGANDDEYPQMDRESGYVNSTNGSAIANVTVNQTGATYRNTTTNATGYWALSTIGRDTVAFNFSKSGFISNYLTAVGYGTSNNNITLNATVLEEAPITNLTVIGYSDDYITWNWTNPTYDEFNHTEIYKNGGWVANITTPDNEVSFLSLDSNTNYTISTRTVDDDGNINETWVNDTQKTLFACGDAQDEICSLGLNLTVPNYNVLSFVNGSFPTTAGGDTFNLTGVVAPLTIDYIRMGVYDGVELGCKDASSITISIATIVGGEPDTVLASEETTCDNIPDSALEYYPFFTDGLSISPDTEYGFYINMSNGTGLDALFVLKNPNNYAYGQHIFANATSVWGTNASWDASFILGYTASSVPPAGRNESYVKWNGSNSNDGSSWTYAWDTIEFAMANTFSNTSSTIHIATGNYTADTEITTGNLALFWCDTAMQENVSRPWCDMPPVNISS